MGSSNYRETILGEATYASVDQVAQGLTGASGKVPTTTVEIHGMIADVSGTTVILNVGKSQGVQVGNDKSSKIPRCLVVCHFRSTTCG